MAQFRLLRPVPVLRPALRTAARRFRWLRVLLVVALATAVYLAGGIGPRSPLDDLELRLSDPGYPVLAGADWRLPIEFANRGPRVLHVAWPVDGTTRGARMVRYNWELTDLHTGRAPVEPPVGWCGTVNCWRTRDWGTLLPLSSTEVPPGFLGQPHLRHPDLAPGRYAVRLHPGFKARLTR